MSTLKVNQIQNLNGDVLLSSSGSDSNLTFVGELRGPANFVIDPSAVGDNTGTVEIKGNLTVQGTTTTINSTTLTIDNKNLTIADGSVDSASANGAGITVAGANATLTYESSGDKWVFNKEPYFSTNKLLNTSDTATANTASKVVIRDASGNFSAGTITATLSGTATNATNINLTNDTTTNATHYPLLGDVTSGNDAIKVSSTKLTFNPSTGVLTATSVFDASGNLRIVPQNSQTSAYTLVAADSGKHISITTGGITVPSGIFSAGDIITVYNNSGSNQTITQGGSVTLRQSGTANTGNRTLAQYGVCTILCVSPNTFAISGAGLT